MNTREVFNWEKGHFSGKTFSSINKNPLKFKYINFRDICHLLLTCNTDQLTEVQ